MFRSASLPASAVQPPLYFDTRWFGDHGIGRFARELFQRLPGATALRIAGAKLSPIDPLASTWALAGLMNGQYFSPGFNPPLRSPIPFSFAIHDLIHLKVPSESSWLRRTYYRTVVGPGARRARCILTGSTHAKREIVEWSGVVPERVHIVGHGVSAAFRSDGPVHAPGFPYFLHVGRRASHKNIPGLLAAYARSRARGELMLMFTGTADPETSRAVRLHGLDRLVHFAGSLDDDGLAALYRGATALVFPSLYEGFGLPIVEAMACGTPVITSDCTSMPEAAGTGGALLVEPGDAQGLADAMDRLASDAELRERLAAHGLARARHFEWEQVVRRASAALELTV